MSFQNVFDSFRASSSASGRFGPKKEILKGVLVEHAMHDHAFIGDLESKCEDRSPESDRG